MALSLPVRPPPQPSPGNHLLAAMTRAERLLVTQAAEPVQHPAGATLLAPGEAIRHVFLPEAGLVSLLAEMPGEGGTVQVGMVGREGLVGLPALLGRPISGLRCVTETPTRSLRIEAAMLAMLTDGSRNLRNLVQQHTMARLAQAGHAAACHALHPLEPRTARWLLEASDRVGPNVRVTQERMALLLGARRPTMNLVLRHFAATGLVRHARGQLGVADRAGLEAVACPCYRLIRAVEARPGADAQH